jgi:hypothetical protein
MDNLEYDSYNFYEMKMNLKCKNMLNINMIKILIIHIVIDCSGNHIKKYG